jgi:acyl-CoA thioesterase-1
MKFKNKKYIFLIIVGILILSILVINMYGNQKQLTNKIRYVALGDSYTIGEGANQGEDWPTLLTNDLQSKGVNIELIADPSVTGWTTQQLIDNELQIYNSSHPTFATLLIGVNDWVQGVSANAFKKNLNYIIDHMEIKLPNKKRLVLITIPDFSVTPTGQQFSNGRDIAKGIAEFNSIIKEEAKTRGLSVVDIYPLTQHMKDNPDLIADDGLHPSAKEYRLWEQMILPVAYSVIK